MDNDPSNIVPAAAMDSILTPEQEIIGQRKMRLRILAITFTVVAVIGLAYTFSQRAIYLSQATMRAAAPETAGTSNFAGGGAIQPQILFSTEMITRTREQLAIEGYSGLNTGDIRRHLGLQVVGDTDLVAIIAEGSDREMLPRIVNTWIDVYLKAQADRTETRSARAAQPIPDELARMAEKLQQARRDLDNFRASNDISSPEQLEREVRSRLQELQRSLKSATAQVEKAGSKLEDLQQDIARGDNIIPRDQQREISNLEKQLRKGEAILADLDARYTREYLARHARYRDLPEQIEALKVEIVRLKAAGNQRSLDDAGEEYRDARKPVIKLQGQIDEQKQKLKGIASILAQHDALVKNLSTLEELDRQNRARLTPGVAQPVGNYPILTVVHLATVAEIPISSNFTRNAIISLSSALAAALFAVWLYGFLNPAHATTPALMHRLPDAGDETAENQPQLSLGLPEGDHGDPDADVEEEPGPR